MRTIIPANDTDGHSLHGLSAYTHFPELETENMNVEPMSCSVGYPLLSSGAG